MTGHSDRSDNSGGHSSLTRREHGVAGRRIGGGDFLLQHIPVFHHLAILEAERERRSTVVSERDVRRKRTHL